MRRGSARRGTESFFGKRAGVDFSPDETPSKASTRSGEAHAADEQPHFTTARCFEHCRDDAVRAQAYARARDELERRARRRCGLGGTRSERATDRDLGGDLIDAALDGAALGVVLDAAQLVAQILELRARALHVAQQAQRLLIEARARRAFDGAAFLGFALGELEGVEALGLERAGLFREQPALFCELADGAFAVDARPWGAARALARRAIRASHKLRATARALEAPGSPSLSRKRRAHDVEVEADRGIGERAAAGRELFEPFVVGGDDDRGAALGERFEDGCGEHGAFLRIGACRDFVEQDQHVRLGAIQDLGELSDVGAEGGQRARQ